MKVAAVLAVSAVAFVSCGGGGGSGTELKPGPTVERFEFTDESDVAEGRPIDQRFTCDGENVSPSLAWIGMPESTKELALVFEDPDAPGATFTHWIVFGIDPEAVSLPRGGSPDGWTGYGPKIIREGENDFGDAAYGGPCPPGGEAHGYVFRLLALDSQTELESGADRAAFDEAVAPDVLAEARLTATYERP